MTSHDVVAYLRKLLGERKAGHCGTLDPLAAGVLAICLGAATGASEHLMGMPKEYRAEVAFGVETDTLDFAGRAVPCMGAAPPARLGAEEVARALARFAGRQMQTPPMHSAVKVGGRRLYSHARDGATVERGPREVEIYAIRMVRFDGARARATFDVRCSKGTYVRALCKDIGAALGVPACMSFLLRTASSGFAADDALTLEQIELLHASGGLAARVVATGDALAALYPAVYVGAAQGRLFCNGGTAEAAAAAEPEPAAGGPGAAAAPADGGADAAPAPLPAAPEPLPAAQPGLLRVYCGALFLGLGREAGPPPQAHGFAPRPSPQAHGPAPRPSPQAFVAVRPVKVFREAKGIGE